MSKFLAGIPDKNSFRREIIKALDVNAAYLHVTFGAKTTPIFQSSDSERLSTTIKTKKVTTTNIPSRITIVLKGKTAQEITAQINNYYPSKHNVEDDGC